MRIGIYNFETIDGIVEGKSFPIFIDHKYWYSWRFGFVWRRNFYGIEICRTDWNKWYKKTCENYTKACKHNMECNACMDCYKEKRK